MKKKNSKSSVKTRFTLSALILIIISYLAGLLGICVSDTDIFCAVLIYTLCMTALAVISLKIIKFKTASFSSPDTGGEAQSHEIQDKEETEFELARKIQMNAMPNRYPVFPELGEFDIYAMMQPAREVGGDFYDFFMTDSNHLAMVAADVSGKGVPAALFMMISKTAIKNQASFSNKPSEILERSNAQLCDSNLDFMFVTAWLGIIDLRTGRLTYALAGHERPFVRHRGVWKQLDVQVGLPLGTAEGSKYTDHTITLENGDMIFEYSDGITDARNKKNSMYTLERLKKTLNASRTIVPQYLLSEIEEDLTSFVGQAEPFDDITMLGFCFRGRKKTWRAPDRTEKPKIMTSGEEQDEMRTATMVFMTGKDSIEDASEMIIDLISPVRPDLKMRSVIRIVMDEMLGNIDSYAYADSSGPVEVYGKFERSERTLTIRLSDKGPEFNPAKYDKYNLDLSPRSKENVGLGIFIAKSRLDSMQYERKDNMNVLTMVKKLH